MTQQIHPFDLQARAEIATRGLTGLLDQERDGLMYFMGNWRARPPRADHNLWDCGDGCGRFTDALSLARRMLSNQSPAFSRGKEDEQLENWMLRFLDQDGLSWLPSEPWAAPWGPELLLAGTQPSEQYAEISWAQRGTLMGLLSRFYSTRDDRYLIYAHKLIDGLLKIAVRHPDGLFFPEGYYRSDGWHTNQTGLFPGIEETNAAMIFPTLRLFNETGYQPALELADGLTRFALKHTQGYRTDGRLHASHGGNVQEHFHTRSNFILGVLKLGLILERKEYIAWARQSYALAKEWGTDFGWFPEHLGQRHGEICCTTDMIEIALLLGKHVSPSYYADAESYGRNHLLESQFLSLDRLTAALAKMPVDSTPPPYEGRYSTDLEVAKRQVGGFASRPTLNDAFHLDGTDLMQCCNAAGARALYDLWCYAVEEILPKNGEPLQENIHLRFSVETPALRVISHEPTAGQLNITTRQDCQVGVRMAAGVFEALAVYTGAHEPRVEVLPAEDGYVHFQANAGENIALHYSLPTRAAEYTVGKPGKIIRCFGTWRGETLMQVEPAGIFYPLYNRPADLKSVEPHLPGSSLIPSL